MTIELERPTATEQTRARYPDAEGYFGLRHHLAETIGPPLEGKGRRPETPRPSRPSAAS